jgi:hypothetical protein
VLLGSPDRFQRNSSQKVETLARLQGKPMTGARLGSNRRFGLLLTAVCALVYAWGLWHSSASVGWLAAALVLLLITLLMPRVLAPAKRLWLKLGGLLHGIVSPVLLGAFYYLGVVPIGFLMQLFGSDPLRRKTQRGTYWVERKPPGPDPKTMPELF